MKLHMRVLVMVLAGLTVLAATISPAAAQDGLVAGSTLGVTADAVISGGTVTITVEFENTGNVHLTPVDIVTSPASGCSAAGITVPAGETFTTVCTIENVTETIPFAVNSTAGIPGFTDILVNSTSVTIVPGEYPGGNEAPGVIPSFNPPGDAVSLDSSNPLLLRAGVVLTSLAAITAAMTLRRRQT